LKQKEYQNLEIIDNEYTEDKAVKYFWDNIKNTLRQHDELIDKT